MLTKVNEAGKNSHAPLALATARKPTPDPQVKVAVEPVTDLLRASFRPLLDTARFCVTVRRHGVLTDVLVRYAESADGVPGLAVWAREAAEHHGWSYRETDADLVDVSLAALPCGWCGTHCPDEVRFDHERSNTGNETTIRERWAA